MDPPRELVMLPRVVDFAARCTRLRQLAVTDRLLLTEVGLVRPGSFQPLKELERRAIKRLRAGVVAEGGVAAAESQEGASRFRRQRTGRRGDRVGDGYRFHEVRSLAQLFKRFAAAPGLLKNGTQSVVRVRQMKLVPGIAREFPYEPGLEFQS